MKRYIHLHSVIFLVTALLWGQLAASSHHHDSDSHETETCDICLVLEASKSALEQTVAGVAVELSTNFLTVPELTDFVTPLLRLDTIRAPPQL